MEPPFRHRSPSFSPLETNLLLDLVEKYGSIITKKCTKSASIIEKERIWQKIAKQFNEANAGSHSRPPETLKLRWDNLKKRCARNDGTFENRDIVSKVQAIIETYKDKESTSVTLQKLANDSDTDLNNVNMEDINVRDDRDSSDTEDDSACKRINRHRSPSFSTLETNLLLDLVEKYGSIITKKCTKSASIIEKERIWQKITKQFNEANAGSHPRPTETLRKRWDNLKKRCAKSDGTFENRDILSKVQAIIETYKDTESTSVTLQKLVNDSDADLNNVNMEDINVHDDRDSSDTEDDSAYKRIKARSINFSPIECQLLIRLVKNEKGGVFSSETKEKFRAWRRIAEAFNRRFPEKKRTSRVLRTKFQNMKNVAKKMNKPVMGQKNNIKGIKEEPVFLTNTDYSNDMSDFNEMQDVSIITETDDCPDPLKVALDNCNSDSGIGPGSDTFKISQDKEVIALHKQLLDFQLETSKLERKRIQDAIDAETEDKRVKSLINAMKLRTARLEMVIAESKLHGSHPALKYTDDEAIISRCS